MSGSTVAWVFGIAFITPLWIGTAVDATRTLGVRQLQLMKISFNKLK
jgi:hypothetical protein